MSFCPLPIEEEMWIFNYADQEEIKAVGYHTRYFQDQSKQRITKLFGPKPAGHHKILGYSQSLCITLLINNV